IPVISNCNYKLPPLVSRCPFASLVRFSPLTCVRPTMYRDVIYVLSSENERIQRNTILIETRLKIFPPPRADHVRTTDGAVSVKDPPGSPQRLRTPCRRHGLFRVVPPRPSG
ncbi:hypothetical protein DPMN_011122, partial [Dreissena polymorpha]